MKTFTFTLFILIFANGVRANPRTSVNYSVATDTTDLGGKRTTSAAYTNDGSAGGIVGVATVAAPAETLKSGYAAELFDVTGLTLTAATLNVNEGATDQLAAWQALDDASFLSMNATGVTWGVLGGPVTGISLSGLATAGAVPQNTDATVQGSFGGLTGTLNLTVLDAIPDNFGLYANDGIDDAWQVQYFGLNNPSAAPNADPDGDGQTNLFEFTAGLSPTDPASHFNVIVGLNAASEQHTVVFSPLVAGRSYTVQYKNSLADPTWQTLTTATQSDNGSTRTVTDTTPTPARFYRVQIDKP